MRGACGLILAPGDGIAAPAGALGVPPALASPQLLSFPASRLVGSLPLGALSHDSWFSLAFQSSQKKKMPKIVFFDSGLQICTLYYKIGLKTVG